jgi:hypothetical protein
MTTQNEQLLKEKIYQIVIDGNLTTDKRVEKLLYKIKEAREEGAIDAYHIFLKTIKEAKQKFPYTKEFEIVADIRDVEKTLSKLAELKK